MNVAVLPVRPVHRHGVSVLGLGKLVRIYPLSPSWPFLLPLQHPLLRRLNAVVEVDTTEPPQTDT